MTTKRTPRDGDAWAKPVDHLEVTGVEPGAAGINVAGRRPTSPVQGFGRMWQKTYRVRLEGSDADPAEVIAVWKRDFPSFWPKGNRFFAPLAGIAAGRGGGARPDHAGRPQALDRRARPLCRRGVVHADDAAGPHVRRLDHLQRVRRRRRDGRSGARPHARFRPALRDGDDLRRAPPGGPPLGAHPAVARGGLRGRGRGHDRERVRRPPAPVGEGGERLAQRGDPFGYVHGRWLP